MQKAYKNQFGKISLKNTETFSKQILSLPIHDNLTLKEVKYVIKIIELFFKRSEN